MKPIVSIITPCYNAEKFLSQTIDSVLCQTWQHWEMIIVDDCSSDKSPEIIKTYHEKDSRIKYLRTSNRSGSPTLPRNMGLECATGRYIAFLDSDDLWLPTKLEEQMQVFMANGDASIVFSYYEKITEEGERSGRIVFSPQIVTYKKLLYGNVIGCLTGIYDTQKVGKVFMRNVGHEDYVMWLEILKKHGFAVNTSTVQALYRIRENSVSSNKFRVLKWQWDIYRNIEKVGMARAIWYFVNYALRAFLKAIK